MYRSIGETNRNITIKRLGFLQYEMSFEKGRLKRFRIVLNPIRLQGSKPPRKPLLL